SPEVCSSDLPAPTLTDMDIRHTVSQRQHKMKTYTDARRGARPPAFQKGDRVRVRNPLHVPKGHRKFSDPLTISKKIGEGTYRLSNGNTWNASHLTGFPTTTHTPTHEDRGIFCQDGSCSVQQLDSLFEKKLLFSRRTNEDKLTTKPLGLPRPNVSIQQVSTKGGKSYIQELE